ncbi:N-acetyltransferase family protein [Legionella sp. D16C41]|uniref:GNAT family N-acetyltransferase n=1 Tax=Legionella sp. D16C41 TaxID=3402688 RepID=UPI003AF7C1B3
MNIELIKNKDWKQFRTLRLEALLSNPEAFGSSFEEEVNLSDKEFEINFNKSTIFGAFEEKDLIGCVGFFIYSFLKMKHKGAVFSMYTKPEYRNLGVGNALLQYVIAYAKDKVMQLHLTVVTTNRAAIELYQKNGFTIYGTEPRALKVNDQFYDEHLMVLNLF